MNLGTPKRETYCNKEGEETQLLIPNIRTQHHPKMAGKLRAYTHTRRGPKTLTLNPKPKTHVTVGIQACKKKKTFCNKGEEEITQKISNIRTQHHPKMAGKLHKYTHTRGEPRTLP